MTEGEAVYHQYNPWRAALTKSLRENRTVGGIKNMELVSSRLNQTKINRVVSFRGFVPDEKSEPRDRLFFVVNANTEKAEQVALDVEAVVKWRFNLTNEEYAITGRVRTIRAHRGRRRYQEYTDEKVVCASHRLDALCAHTQAMMTQTDTHVPGVTHARSLSLSALSSLQVPEEAELESLLHYRRIAWNSCSPGERAAFMFPDVVEV